MSRREFRVSLDLPRPAAALVMGSAATATLAITGQVSPAALALAVLAIGGAAFWRERPLRWQRNPWLLNAALGAIAAASLALWVRGALALVALAHFAVLDPGAPAPRRPAAALRIPAGRARALPGGPRREPHGQPALPPAPRGVRRDRRMDADRPHAARRGDRSGRARGGAARAHPAALRRHRHRQPRHGADRRRDLPAAAPRALRSAFSPAASGAPSVFRASRIASSSATSGASGWIPRWRCASTPSKASRRARRTPTGGASPSTASTAGAGPSLRAAASSCRARASWGSPSATSRAASASSSASCASP